VCGPRELRAQVAEGLRPAAGPKAAIAEFVSEHKGYPVTNANAGLEEPQKIYGNYVQAVYVDNGVLVIEYKYYAREQLAGRHLYIALDYDAFRDLVWICGSKEWRSVASLKVSLSCLVLPE
jgi:hypothetical protein